MLHYKKQYETNHIILRRVNEMKKLLWSILCGSLIMVLAACGSGTDSGESQAANEVPFMIPTVEGSERVVIVTDLNVNQELFISDLDYMLDVLEDNFALFDAALWAHGMDIERTIANLQREIADNPGMDVDDFYETLRQMTTQYGSVGNLGIVRPRLHRQFGNNRAFPAGQLEHVREFYVPRHPTGPMHVDDVSEVVIGLGEGGFRRFVEWLYLWGEDELDELAEEILFAWEHGEYNLTRDLIRQAYDIINEIPNIYSDIIEDGRIAYLAINNFAGRATAGNIEGRNLIFEFYEEIRDYEHLIIDLRRNTGGGSWSFFRDNIIRPNMSVNERTTINGFGFTPWGSEYLEPHLETVRNNRMFTFSFMDDATPQGGLLEVDDILNNHDLPEINMFDMERMDYGFLLQVSSLIPRNDEEPAFGGKIWLLTGPSTMRQAEVAARVSMEMEFATLVGETSGGSVSGPAVFVPLPNTGIIFAFDSFYITDSVGRPYDAGTVPHHFNMDGMDALETALTLINRGEY